MRSLLTVCFLSGSGTDFAAGFRVGGCLSGCLFGCVVGNFPAGFAAAWDCCLTGALLG